MNLEQSNRSSSLSKSSKRFLKKSWKRSRAAVRRLREDQNYRAIYAKHRHLTQIPRPIYIDNLRLVEAALRADGLANGCIIECGTWRGGMSFGLVDISPSIEEFHFFDSFEGMPPVGPMDGQLAQRLQEYGALPAINNYADYDEFIRNVARYDAATQAKVHVHKGWFEQTLANFRPNRPISVLRLDSDWYDSTILLLETLYDHVADRGLIIIDDYLAFEGCSRAVHQFLAKRQSSERLQQTGPEGVCYIIKNLSPLQECISTKYLSRGRRRT